MNRRPEAAAAPSRSRAKRIVSGIFRVFFLCLLLHALPAAAQETVKKSTKTEVIDGKKYYLHTVEKKQTLYAIAKAYDVTVNDIILENPQAMGEIKPGQVLRIPAFKPVVTPPTTMTTTSKTDTTAYFYHKVEPGQTLYGIAKQYNLKQEDIEALNPDAKTGIRTGQLLKIPGKAVKTPGVTIDPNATVIADTIPQARLKDVYKVAVFLPFHLEGVSDIDIDEIRARKATFPQKSEIALQFYEGVLLAVDSLRRTGLNTKLYVYDTDENDSSRIVTMLRTQPEFATMDLFIGPLYPSVFKPVANFAKEHHVPAVSPISPSNRVLFKNDYTSKTTPSLTTQMEQLAQYVAKQHAGDNVIVITTSSIKEAAFSSAFIKAYNTARYPDGHDSVHVLKGVAGLDALVSATANNVVIVPSVSQVFVTDMLRSLNNLTDKDKKKFTLYGMATWTSYDNLDYTYLQNLNFHYPTPYFIDYSDTLTRRFLHTYQRTCRGDASMYAFEGYDVTMFYLNGLREYGTGLQQKLPELKGRGLQQTFDFYQSDAESGYENRGIQVIYMQDYQLLKEHK